MTRNAKVRKRVSISSADSAASVAQPDYQLIDRRDLQISPTNPRRRMDEASIESLAASIRTQGVLEPLIVRAKLGKNRKDTTKYEIVCGERRYRAASIAEVTELPCLIRELSDEQVLDIQIHENLHREDVHPMDEAYGYQFLKEKLGCDVKELALRVGKSDGYVLNRLKLNLLIKEAQKDIDDGHLPLTYALEIAKYTPDIQEMIYAEVYRKEGKYQKDQYVQVPIKGQTVPWKSFIEWINLNIHHLLSKAPFDPKATNLRPDGLACISCPERTGAGVSLFEPNQIGRKDACLNPACFRLKAENYIDVRRAAAGKAAGIVPSEVPIVRSGCYSDGDNYLGTESAVVVVGSKRGGRVKKCRNAVSAIDIEADNFGQTVEVCLKSSECKVHWSKGSGLGTDTAGKSSEREIADRLESRRARREEIWNAKVAETVRVRVLKQAAEAFEKKFRITDVGTEFLPQLIARFWRMTASGDSNNLNEVIRPLLGEWSGEPKNGGAPISGPRIEIESFKKLARGVQFRLLFLLIHCHKGTIGYSNNYTSQKEVRQLAADFQVNYPLIDAEVRLEFSAKKHKQSHQIYLEGVQRKKKDAKVPNLFSEKWKAID